MVINTEELRFLKLISLGWNGKDDPIDFLTTKFGLEVQIKNKVYISITINKYTNFTTVHYNKPVDKNKIIDTILMLFKTVNGTIYGPDTKLHLDENYEWT